jgi:phosphatidylinositol alpha-1,6-mannosyltransferase
MHALVRHPELRFAVVGDGPELPRLKELAGKLGLGNVDFIGIVQEQEKQRLLARSRLFVMCPRNDNDGDVEGLGLVYFEAHGAGLPVLGARSGGEPEAIGDAGIIVDDPLDISAIENAFLTALNPDEFAKLKAAVKIRQVTHSWERFVDGLENWYMELA